MSFRPFFLPALVLLAAVVCVAAEPQSVALLPLDSRPACTDMPVMMGAIAGVPVTLPPAEALGAFTTPGDCAALSAWLNEEASQAGALIVSIDMLCYGGLIPSRVGDVPLETARRRLEVLRAIRKEHPSLPIYAFNAIMRTAPTATKEAADWRMHLARYLYYADKAKVTGGRNYADAAADHLRRVPKGELAKYRATRERDHEIHAAAIRLVKDGVIDYLILGQDDADQYGPHRAERVALEKMIQEAGVAGKALLCGGIDQTACTLLARAVARARDLTPRVVVEWASQDGRHVVPPNEGQSVDKATRFQIYAAGGRPADTREDASVLLFVNTFERSETEFGRFKRDFTASLEAGRMVAIADLNMQNGGRADRDLFRYLLENRLGGELAAYAGWNTASNTLGTAIPQAMLYWIARQDPDMDVGARELAQREFILQRFASDYGYHNYIRPLAYDYLVDELKGSKEEVDGSDFERLEGFVKKHTRTMLDSFFDMGFKGTRFPVGRDGRMATVTGLEGVTIGLPWPRAYEVAIRFRLVASVSAGDAADP